MAFRTVWPRPVLSGRNCVLLAALLLFCGWSGGPTAAALPQEKIQSMIDRGVGYLRYEVMQVHFRNGALSDFSKSALVALALLKAGEPPNSTELSVILPRLAGRVVDGEFKPGANHYYDAGVTLMALANANREKYKPEIEAIANYIIAGQRPEGDWDYPTRPTTGDTSISQYAILGLWEAARSGVRVPKSVWDKAANWHLTRQLADGSFTYHPTGRNGQGQLVRDPPASVRRCKGN
jgi:hypothetical protein